MDPNKTATTSDFIWWLLKYAIPVIASILSAVISYFKSRSAKANAEVAEKAASDAKIEARRICNTIALEKLCHTCDELQTVIMSENWSFASALASQLMGGIARFPILSKSRVDNRKSISRTAEDAARELCHKLTRTVAEQVDKNVKQACAAILVDLRATLHKAAAEAGQEVM